MTDQRPIGFWLKLTDRLIDEQFSATLDEHGITRRQWQLLNVLARGSATVEQLDAAVAPFLEPATADAAAESSVEHLTELIESGWVDATARGYELTDRGITALERLTVVVSEQRTVLARGITDEEYRSTIDVLERVSRNLGWSDA
jgi:DNA-binding MarR family transcriptional regulator